MFVGVCRISLHLHGNASLKGKRSILRRVVERTKNKFNAAVAEIGDNDAHQSAKIGIAVVGNSASHVDSMLGHIGSFVEYLGVAAVVAVETEVIPLGGELSGRPAFRGETFGAPCYDAAGDFENGDDEDEEAF